MITVLVYYKEWVDPEHWAFDGKFVENSQIVEVTNLTDLNDVFDQITKIEILDEKEYLFELETLMLEIKERINYIKASDLFDDVVKDSRLRENKLFLTRCQQLWLSTVSTNQQPPKPPEYRVLREGEIPKKPE